MVAYIVNMVIIWDDRPRVQAIRGQRGGNTYRVISVNPDISRVWSMDPEDRVITGFHCIAYTYYIMFSIIRGIKNKRAKMALDRSPEFLR